MPEFNKYDSTQIYVRKGFYKSPERESGWLWLARFDSVPKPLPKPYLVQLPNVSENAFLICPKSL